MSILEIEAVVTAVEGLGPRLVEKVASNVEIHSKVTRMIKPSLFEKVPS